MKALFQNYFLSGTRNLTTEMRRRVILLNGIFLIGLFALIPAGFTALVFGKNYTLAIFDAAFALLSLVFIFWLRLRKQVRATGIALTTLILILFAFLLVTGGDKNTGPLWLYLYPLFTFFLVGGQIAVWLNGGFILVTGFLLFLPGMLQTSYDPAFKLRFLGSLITLAGITWVFEYSRKDAQVKMLAAQKETDDIFHAIREGLFLLTARESGFFIGSRYSVIVEEMLASNHLAEREFIPLLKTRYPQLNEDGLAQYLALLYKEDLDEVMLADLNPLKLLEGQRTLSFTFYRVIQPKTGRVESIMCSIEDKTEAVKLQRELAEREENENRHAVLLLQILHTNPGLLSDFIETAESYEQEIHALLSTATTVDSSLLDLAFRKIHTIKGDARALGLGIVGERADNVEAAIAALQGQNTLTGADLLPLIAGLGNLRQILATLHELTRLIRSHRGGEALMTQTPLKDTLHNLIRQLKLTFEKDVQLDTALFDETRIPVKLRRPMQEILIQLIRNSFAHGIEDENERGHAAKKATGTIALELKAFPGHFEIHYSDDGRGLSAEKIKAKAVQGGLVSPDEVGGWDNRKIFGLIFRKGFSTAENTGMDAGRGVGMDIIQENVRQLNGRIRLRTKAGSGVAFTFEFPSHQ